MKSRTPVVFVHVPKTAGTAVTSYLARLCAGKRQGLAPPFVGDYSIYDNPPGDWPVIAGHFPYSRIRAVVPRGEYVTFLRDPVARAISQYRSWKDPGKLIGRWRDVLSPADKAFFDWVSRSTLEEFVMSENPRVVKGLGNTMTTFLSTDGTADVSSALDNLATRFAVFGVQELFEESVEQLRRRFPRIGPYRQSAAAENRSRVAVGEITAAVRRRLEALNAADIAFYEAAVDLFRRRVSRRWCWSWPLAA